MPDIKAAVIDLYNNEPNEGIRCIKDLLNEAKLPYKVFDTRYKDEIPGLEYDIFISSGGPGSPFDGEGSHWEGLYFNLIEKIWNHNQNNKERKKYIFFICHSFQMMCRFFNLGTVSKRDKPSFGLLPFIKTEDGMSDALLKPLPDPFYAADIRKYQVIQPESGLLPVSDAKILSYEIPAAGSTTRSAMTAIRLSNEIIGTQFHPEADPDSLMHHFKQDERKQQVVDLFGPGKYEEMLGSLNDEDKIKLTRKTVLPGFLSRAVAELNSVYTE